MAFAGLMCGITRRVMISTRDAVARCSNVLRGRWPDGVVKELKQEESTWTMTAVDAADLGSRRRGVELLRIVIMPQRVLRVVVAPTPVIEPMPL